jgi:ATP-binding cassette subfamily B protein
VAQRLTLVLATFPLALAATLWLVHRRRRRPPAASSDGGAMPGGHVYRDVVLYRRLLREARPYWAHIAALFLVSLLATPVALLTPLPLAIAVDSVVGSHSLPGFLEAVAGPLGHSDTGVLAMAVLLLLAVAVLNQFQLGVTDVLGTYVGERLVLRFRARLFRHVQRLSLAFHDTRGTADSIYRIQYDAPAVQWIAIYGVTPFVSAALTLAGMIVVTARVDWRIAAVALTIAPVLFMLTWISRRLLRTGWRDAKLLESSALSVVQEVLTGLRVVKAFTGEEREHERFLARSGASVRARTRLAALEGVFGLLIGLTLAIGTALVLLIGVHQVQAGAMTIGALILVMSYLAQLYAPLQAIHKSIATLQSSFASAERALTLLDEVPDVVERPRARALTRARGAVSFQGVSFAYPGGVPVLHDLWLDVAPGTSVGIAGTTGAGKTTLVSLLSRFYDPSEGAILLDGHDLREYRVKDLRDQFGIVLQEPVLFSTSIAENIAYARPGAGEDEILAAARAANAHDFVSCLPDGYGTVVGERGMRLSGGERQRISLARAFLRDAPILILDEPTSSVDTATEAAIMQAMERLMAGRTTFMIAHRVSTLAYCDLRVSIEGGRLRTDPDAPADYGWSHSARTVV